VPGYQIVEGAKAFTLPPGGDGTDTFTVACPAGDKALGGGATVSVTPIQTNGPTLAIANLSASNPTGGGLAWSASLTYFHENVGAGQSATLEISVVCAAVK
jgi:hypothetical protein